MTECELCGSVENVFEGHYEEHLDEPRKINICNSCHSSLHGRLCSHKEETYDHEIPGLAVHIPEAADFRRKEVKSFSKTASHVFVPKDWEGDEVAVILLEEEGT